MSSEDPLYERDPEAWNAHLAEGNAKQARKRVSADVILRDAHGRILLVDPRYKPDWDLPGGMAEANEPPADAVRRELREELGLDLQVGYLLCVDWISPHGPWDDLVNFIFDGGVLDERAIASLRLMDDELRAYDLFDEGQVKERLRPYVWRRVRVALEALTTGGRDTCRMDTVYVGVFRYHLTTSTGCTAKACSGPSAGYVVSQSVLMTHHCERGTGGRADQGAGAQVAELRLPAGP